MINVICDNILNAKVDAIVNPANVSVLAASELCGPLWLDGNHSEDELLALTYQNIVKEAVANHLSSISIPAIPTGIYRFPIQAATDITIAIIKQECLDKKIDVTFFIKELDKYQVYQKLLTC